MQLVTNMYVNVISKFSEEEKQQFEEGRFLYSHRRFYTKRQRSSHHAPTKSRNTCVILL